MTAVTRLSLDNFRNHRDALVETGAGFVLLSGSNGAGKTNVLEAVSLLTPGRGLRQVPIAEMARSEGSGAFAVAARLDDGTEIGTGTSAEITDRRQVRINGAPTAANLLGERLAVLWLTPAMDRLFTGSPGDRRRFLDRLTLALEPSHAHHAARYEAAMRARNKLLAEELRDDSWLGSLEAQMEQHGNEVTAARARTVRALNHAARAVRSEDFPSASLTLDKQSPTQLAGKLAAARKIDAAARRATCGPNNEDLVVVFAAKGQPAAKCSTGEQKALLLNLVLSHAEIVADQRGSPPILLLDEVAAHLDPDRRAALFTRLEGSGQVWMTATEAALFDPIGLSASRFHVEAGTISPV